jgi:hypothetical protein
MKTPSNKAKTKTQSRVTRLENFSFPSMENAEARTGIPKTILQKLKADGCPAFRHSRIYFLEVVKAFADMVFKSNGGDVPDWKGVDEEYTARLKQFAFDEKCRNVITLDEAKELIQALMLICAGSLKRFAIEFPKTLEQRSAAEIKMACDRQYREILARMTAEIEAMQ